MHAQVNRWGNSLGVRIPKTLADRLRLTDGMRVDITAEAERLIIAIPRSPTLADILRDTTPAEMRAAFDWGPDLGRESID